MSLGILAQSPSLINYQGAARLADGTPLDNRTISIKFDIHQSSASGSVVASESQTLQTNALGLFSTQIGKTANLGVINWQGNSHFLEVSMDTSAGSNFTSIGVQQLVSVPYALHANSVPSSYTNNILSIGSDTYAMTPTMAATPNTSITVSGLGTVTSAGTNTFDINIPAPNLTGQGATTVSGTYPNYTLSTDVPSLAISATAAAGPSVTSSGNSFSINVPPPTFTNTGQNIVTGTYPNFTVNTPTVPAAVTPSIALTTTAAAGASVSSAGSSFSLNVPPPVFNNTGQNIITGTYPNFSVNTPTVPAPITPSIAVTTTAAAGASVSSTGSSFSINVPPPSFTNTGQNIITGTYPNFTVNTPTVGATPLTTVSPSGLVTVLNPATNSFVVGVQTPTFTNTGQNIITGSYPNFSVNTPTTAAPPTVSGVGIVTVTGAPNYLVDVQAPVFNNTGQNIITGTYPNYSVNTPTVPAAITPSIAVTTTAAAGASVSSAGSSFSINVPPPAFTNTGQNIITGTYPNFSVNTPTVPAPSTVSGAGIVTVTGTPDYTVSVSTPTFNNTGQNIITGTYPNYSVNTPTVPGTSIAVTSTAAAGPSVSVIGTNSFNINIPPSSAWSFTGNAGTSTVTNFIGTTDANNLNFKTNGALAVSINTLGYVGVGTSNPVAMLQVVNGNATSDGISVDANNVANGGNALQVRHFGTGNASYFEVNNTASTSHAVIATSNSSGQHTMRVLNTNAGLTSYAGMFEGGLIGRGKNNAAGFALKGMNFAGSDLFVVRNDGAVGIGTNAPAATLHVAGTTRLADGTQAAGRVLTSDALGNASWNTLTAWSYTGNAGTSTVSNFIGTTDANNLHIKTNGALAMIITTSGNVGIGAFSNTNKLNVDGNISLDDVGGTSAPSRVIGFPVASTGNHGSLTIQAKSNIFSGTLFQGGDLVLSGGDYNRSGAPSNGYGGNVTIKTGKNVFDGSGGPDIIFMAGGSSSTHTERMRILGFSGNVGINTNAPAALLTIDNQSVTTRNGLHILNGRDQVGSGMPMQIMATTTGQTFGTNTFGRILRLENSTLGFMDMGIDQGGSYFISRSASYYPNADLVVTSTGNIGIGNSLPHAPLQFDNSIVNRKIVLWEGANNDHQFYGFGINGATLRYQVDATGADHVFFAGTGVVSSNELMRIKGNGNVGIGTSSPAFRFEVAPGSTGITDDQGHATFYHAGNFGGAIRAESNASGNSGGSGTPYAQAFIAGIHSNSPVGSQNIGVWGNASGGGANGWGVVASHGSIGSPTKYAAFAGPSLAGFFQGNVQIVGNIAKSSGTFKIDHPQDPANKFLYHSFVESPDMMNVYNGNITTDANGDAVVQLPAYFESLNIDFRYQLTAIGQFAQVIVSEEIKDNQFKIKTDKPNVKVSWQVTGVRNDEYARANRVVPEVEKKDGEKGKYLHPELFGYGKEMEIGAGAPPKTQTAQGQQQK